MKAYVGILISLLGLFGLFGLVGPRRGVAVLLVAIGSRWLYMEWREWRRR